MRFDEVLVVGSGKIACDCTRYLISIVPQDRIFVLETQISTLSMLSQICNKGQMQYALITERDGIESWILEKINRKRSLIISVNNRFIFTPSIIDSEGTVIINFHYSLLPFYRGMNIPTWVIFNGENQTGVTWHYVTREVDKGDIIEQRVIEISDDTTAFEVVRQGMILGLEAFKNFIEKILNEPVIGRKITYPNDDKVYYMSKLPMNGILDICLPIQHIERMLRSFDYGRAQILPKLKVIYMGKEYQLEKYKIEKVKFTPTREIDFNINSIVVCEGNKRITLFLSC